MNMYAEVRSGRIFVSKTNFEGSQTVVVNVTTRKNDYGVPDKYEVDEAGKITLSSVETIAAREAAQQAEQATEALYQARLAKQVKTCDANFFAILSSIRLMEKIVPEYVIRPKAKKCLDWLEVLWISEDPESLLDCPHKFLEVRIEAEA